MKQQRTNPYSDFSQWQDKMIASAQKRFGLEVRIEVVSQKYVLSHDQIVKVILRHVSNKSRVPVKKITGSRKFIEVYDARAISMYMTKEFCNKYSYKISISKVARYFNRTHAAARHAFKIYNNRMRLEPSFFILSLDCFELIEVEIKSLINHAKQAQC